MKKVLIKTKASKKTPTLGKLFINKKPAKLRQNLTVAELKTRLGLALVRLNAYRKKYRIQMAISTVLAVILVIIFYQVPLIKASPQAASVTITSDADWALGTLSNVTPSGGAIDIDAHEWPFRQKINFSNTSGSAHSNIPIMIPIIVGNINFWTNTANRNRINVYDSDFTTELDFHFEKFDHVANDAIAWVEVPNLASGADSIYLYYGKTSDSAKEDEGGTYDTDGRFQMVQHLEETSGTILSDSTANGFDGSPVGGLNLNATGQINGADLFDGIDDYVLIDSGLNPSNWPALTLESWVRHDEIDDNEKVMGWSDGTTSIGIASSLSTSEDGLLVVLGGVFDYGQIVPYNLSSWSYVTLVYDGAGSTNLDKLKLYINGSQQTLAFHGSASVPNLVPNLAARTMRIGQAGEQVGRWLGPIDEVRVSNSARSAAWINASYLSESGTLISSWGSQQDAIKGSGTYTSQSLDDSDDQGDGLDNIYKWGDFTNPDAGNTTAFSANISASANATVKFEIMHSADGSTNWSNWTTIDTYSSGGAVSKTRNQMVALIGDITNRYVQIRITLTSIDGVTNPTVSDYALSYTRDMDNPINPSSATGYSANGGTGITSGNWYNYAGPYFTWSGDSDAHSGMSGGYAGYYVYFGTNASADPAVAGVFQIPATYTASSLTSGQTYYLRIKARDAAGNVPASAYDAFTYKFDTTLPTSPSLVTSSPAGYTNINNFTFLWTAGSDSDSGVAQYCYKTGAVGSTDTCITGTSVTGIAAYQDGGNVFYVRSKDNAGNTASSYSQVSYYYNGSAPSAPQNLAVTPSISTTNSFTFSWNAPAIYQGSIASYHYSINALPTATNTTMTTATSIGPGAYATQQGENIFYVVAKDEAGNINYNLYASVSFTANTTAPGIPTGVIVTDTSIRSQQKYSLTATWDAPVNVGSGIDHYNVERSDDNKATWSEVSQVSGAGYLDTGLTQNATYCYRIYASDSANAVSAASSEVCEQARGRYYSAPNLIGSPAVDARIQSAVVGWLTDRGCSSFVEYGLTNAYGYESGQEDFVTTHSVTLPDLLPDTTYHYRVKFIDEDNNTGYSADSTFTTADAPSAPTNLAVTPASSTTNSFTFSWGRPAEAGITIRGYYYSVNTVPTAASTSFTAQTTLGPGPYATQQGVNTFYVVAIDSSNNINYSNYASVEFQATTPAPPIPTGLIITDSSNREEKVYSITIVWELDATQISDTDINFIIERSIDSSTDFSQIAETDSYGYLDVGLDNTRTYYYRIKAKDSAGSTSAASSIVSEIPEGRYTSPPAITSGPTATPDSFNATVTWETERNADSHVGYGLTNSLGDEQGTIVESKDHAIILEGLQSETLYYYRIRSRDQDGNVAISSINSFTTLQAPRVANVSVANVRLFDALITWSTNKETTTRLEYGTTTKYGSVVYDPSNSLTKSHTVFLTGLTDDTTYHFRPTGSDATGNTPESSDYSFTTLTYPKISSISTVNKAEGQTEITWTTNVPTTSQVEYYSAEIPAKTQGNASLVTNHSILLFGLEDATDYRFTIQGYDQFGYQAVSETNTFSTLEDVTPPVIFGIKSDSKTIGSGEVSKIQIVVSWKTNEPTTSKVEYGIGLTGEKYTAETEETAELVLEHLVIISDLASVKTYHFRVVSKDKAGNVSQSEAYSVLTAKQRKSYLQLIVSNLEEIFSWLQGLELLYK